MIKGLSAIRALSTLSCSPSVCTAAFSGVFSHDPKVPHPLQVCLLRHQEAHLPLTARVRHVPLPQPVAGQERWSTLTGRARSEAVMLPLVAGRLGQLKGILVCLDLLLGWICSLSSPRSPVCLAPPFLPFPHLGPYPPTSYFSKSQHPGN